MMIPLSSTTPDTTTLLRVLEELLAKHITSLTRALSPYSSSFRIENLDLTLEDGEELRLIFKSLGRDSMLAEAREAKPEFVLNPEREIRVYLELLSTLDLGTPRCPGAVMDPAYDRYWLFIERIEAPPLYEIGELEVWLKAARWIAAFHGAAARAPLREVQAVLLQQTPQYYVQWAERAFRAVGPALDPVKHVYPEVMDTLTQLSCWPIHGEFYASNIMVAGRRLCPVDWEMTSIGPGLMDIAALASGQWRPVERLQIATAYVDRLPPEMRPGNWRRAFAACQLQTALQWLGWNPKWSAPQTHAHDWLQEARELAEDSFSAPVS